MEAIPFIEETEQYVKEAYMRTENTKLNTSISDLCLLKSYQDLFKYNHHTNREINFMNQTKIGTITSVIVDTNFIRM